MQNDHELTNVKHDDDKNLAIWIKANYLPRDFNGVIDQGGVTINGTEGFAKLYNAYKRVRTLTNRAQDKWPFFDRRWKSMTSAQVTKMATSEDATSSSDASNKPSLKGSSVQEWIGNGSEATADQSQPEVPSPALDQIAVDQPLAMVLAAESAPEHSNLDELPASSGRKRKRGNPDYDDNGRFARGHGNLRPNKSGRRGGRGGRGRQTKSKATETADSANGVRDHTPSSFEDEASLEDNDTEMADVPVEKPKAVPPSPRVTRRQTRLYKGSDDQTISTQHLTAKAGTEAAGSRKPRADSDATAVDVKNTTATEAKEGTTSPDHEDTLVADNDSAITVPTDADLLTMGFSHSDRHKTATSTAKDVQKSGEFDSTTESKKQTVEQDDELQERGVKYFARVNTGTASLEVSLDETIIGEDKELRSDLLGYAAWREARGEKSKSISFDTWRSIFSFGR
ncbi:hypothetical protein SLS60_006408 [Paraconiothyrium brasiliense]|uniref:Uncharacterized protein n=1 Tax=Paraconiothyrium brasiliense TaxID=300254 RepID=A0ABR3RAN8_9PLEO